MTRTFRLSLAALAVAVVVLPLLMAPGGFPSRPRFQSIGVGITAPSNVGEAIFQSNVDAARTVTIDNDSNGATNLARLSISSGDANLSVFVTGSGRTSSTITNGPTGAQAGMRTLGAHPLIFGTSNTLALTIDSAQVADFVNTPTVAGAALNAVSVGLVRANSSGSILDDRNVDTVTDIAGTGVWQVNFTSGTFSTAPFCSCVTTAAGQCAQVGSLSSSAARFETRDATGTLTDLGFHAMCMR